MCAMHLQTTSYPGVLPCLQEWWGVTDIIKAHAEKINKIGGYRCLVPDLYKEKIGVVKEEAAHVCGSQYLFQGL